MISDVATKRGCSIKISCYGSDTNPLRGAKQDNQIRIISSGNGLQNLRKNSN